MSDLHNISHGSHNLVDPALIELVNQVPTDPGCYLWKNAAGKVLYVGKAKNLRARMRQYVHGTDERIKIPFLMDETAGFDYVVVGSEHEALVLEINLIQQYHPPYNVDLKDDKSYPYIALTKGDVFPALKYTREKHKPSTRYFGPYTDAKSAREMIDIVRKVTPFCVGTCAEWRRVNRLAQSHPDDKDIIQLICAQQGRPCFDFHVGKGPGVCAGEITPQAYAQNVRLVEDFLSGHRGTFISELTAHMHDAAAQLDFEKAGRIKRRLDIIKSLDDKQRVVFPTPLDADFIGFWREETIAGACIFLVREGRVIRNCEFILDKGNDVPEQELVSGFVKRYYEQTADIPLEVNIPVEVVDAQALEEWLSTKRGRKVVLHVPQRGEKAHLASMASTNAHHALMRYELRSGYDDKRTNDALMQLESALALDGPPLRIECFDISTIHGKHTVASMVVFTAGKPDTSQYRRFKIKTPLTEANDVVSMAEVMERRYGPQRMADERFGKKPDLLILDGGKPQLNAARKQLAELGVDIPMAGLAKSDEELFVLWDDAPVVLPSGSASLYLVKQVRDEAHRFAITFHRELRDKAMTVSLLDEIDGVGATRKKALKKAFGSMKKLRAASLEEIAAVPGIPQAVAQNVYETLRAWDAELAKTRKRAATGK
ncbi:MAG: excinuclease ABC subunit UvrC [Atopobium sp.]|uniref:excinuclease ABC subunit UvrC n=1 Tax=Atopobium sp. TaxID=1872650 RepID=UPI002A808144|nr:excinuclease ABC subunit UvrC [Atopobium sp.]MDY4523286.1 excinuclease ABC subunit UvrC [Atopobium sp.]